MREVASEHHAAPWRRDGRAFNLPLQQAPLGLALFVFGPCQHDVRGFVPRQRFAVDLGQLRGFGGPVVALQRQVQLLLDVSAMRQRSHTHTALVAKKAYADAFTIQQLRHFSDRGGGSGAKSLRFQNARLQAQHQVAARQLRGTGMYWNGSVSRPWLGPL